MTAKNPISTAAGQARETTEKAAGAWKEGMKKLADQATMIPAVPPVDLNQSVEQYFQFVQRTVDPEPGPGHQMGGTGEHPDRRDAGTSRIIQPDRQGPGRHLANLAARQAEKTEQVTQERAEQAERAQKGQARQARQAERERVKQDRATAREAYEGLTKAELGDQLTERGLPKTGNVDDLIDRLVEADTR